MDLTLLIEIKQCLTKDLIRVKQENTQLRGKVSKQLLKDTKCILKASDCVNDCMTREFFSIELNKPDWAPESMKKWNSMHFQLSGVRTLFDRCWLFTDGARYRC